MRIKRYLGLFLVALVSVFVLGFSVQDVSANTNEIIITAISKYESSHNVQIEKGSINEHLIFENNNNVIDIEYNADGRLNNIFNNSSGQIRLYSGSITIKVLESNEYLISKVEMLNNPENLSIDGVAGNSATFEEPKQQTTIVHTASSGRSDIQSIRITVTTVSSGLNASVKQLFGPKNEISVPNITAEFGNDVVVPVTESGDNVFQFALVNGVIRNDFIVGDNTLPITEGLDVSLVYATEDTHAVLFLDSNGKLISNTWVANGENVTAPATEDLSKPGYKLSETPWLSNEGVESLENITSSRVYRLQYELEETSKVNITVGETTTEYNFNDVVTLTAANPDFKAWVDENDNILSTSETFKFTALTNRTVNESTEVTLPTTPIITMTNDLGLREGMQSFLGQLELRETDTLVEHGLVVTKDGLLRDEELTLTNGTKAKSNVLVPATNEFLLSIGEDYLVVRAFVTVRNAEGVIETFYSNNQYNDVAIVTFDTDGGNEIDPVAIKVGTTVQKPANPVRPSHDFLGWFVGETEFNFTTLVTEDTIITAKWQENLPTIAEVRALAVDTATEFKGIVTGIDGNNLFVQDETAAIYLFGAKLPEGLKVGDEVRIQGTRDVYAGLQQIGSGATVTIESSDNALPTILEVTDVTTLGASSQTQRITVDGLTVKSQSGNNLILTDGTNDILVYASTGSAVYNHIQTAIVGQEVNIHEAFVGWFNGVQLTVLDVEDLEFVEPSDEELAQLVLDEIVAEWSNKEFNMGTSVELPLTGDFDSTVVWEFDPENAVVEGKWNEVNEDTIYTILVTVTLGEAEVDDIFEIFIKFIDTGEPVSKQETMEFGSAKYTESKTSQNGLKTIGELGVTVTSSTAYWDGNANNSLRLGSSKNPGSITLAFNENVKITKVIIYASQYDGAVSIKVNELTTQVVTNATGSEYIGYEFNINNLSSFTVSSVKTSKSRVQIQKIVIEYSPN